MAEPRPQGSSMLPKVADIIENLGLGPFVAKEIFLGGSTWLSAGAQLITISAVTLVIAKEWGLEAWQRGILVSMIFIGIMLGNFASGPSSDIIGRRPPILISYALVVFFSIASSFASGFRVLCIMRLLLGISFGFAQPAWNTLGIEITPAYWRGIPNVAGSFLFVVGEIFAGCLVWLDDPSMKTLNWRLLSMYAAAPAAVMGVVCVCFLNESASWLALQGETEKAKNVLKSIRWWNRKEEESVEFAPPLALTPRNQFDSIREQIDATTGPVLRFTTGVLCFSCFVLNFVYYGTFYSFPIVMGEVDMGVSPALALIIGALWELPGYAAAIVASLLWGRRVSTLGYLVLMIVSTVMFMEGAKRQKDGGGLAEYAVHAGFAGMKCWINMGFCILYQYASEIYPTSARVAGTGICFGCGRLGSMVVPMVFEWVMVAFNDQWQIFFYAMIAILSVNCILILLLPYETSGMTLKDHVDELGELEPLMSCGARKV